jgi:hypothetical protein
MSDQLDTDQDVGYYVYALVPADAEVPALSGLDDVTVEVIPSGDLAAVVSRFALERPPGRRAELLAHTRVVDALARSGPVVPVQFGSVLEHDTEAVEELLADQAELAGEALERVRGKVQLNLRVSYVEERILEEVVREHPRIADLHRRTRGLPEGTVHPDLVRLGEEVANAMSAKREQDAAMVMQQVEPHVVDSVERAGGGVDHVLDVALLVDEATTDELEEHLEQLAERTHERLRLRLVGPVAPYDFTGDAAWG